MESRIWPQRAKLGRQNRIAQEDKPRTATSQSAWILPAALRAQISISGLPRQDQRGTDVANHLCATRLAPEKSIKQVGQDRRLSALIRLKGV